jgi:hypothetical protein
MISSYAFANTIQLYTEPHARRLFKARHHEVDKLQIHTQSLTDSEAAKTSLLARSCTLYMFQIRSANSKPRPNADADAAAHDEWLLTRRYSECAAFRDLILRLVRQWESQIEDVMHSHEIKLQSREIELVSNALRRPITPNFPRKHMRGDNDVIVLERCRGLCAFVRMLLDAYADISVYMFNSRHSRTSVGPDALLRSINEKLEQFLQIPEAQKELQRRHTAAVLALEDVPFTSKTRDHKDEHPERTCCICLDDYDSEEELSAELRFLNGLEECQLEALARDKMVKLPCQHHFHEDCVIEWFNTSVTCPLCRTPVVPAEDKPRELEVVMPM